MSTSRRFSFEKAHKLDDPARRQEQPPEVVVSSLDLRAGHVVVDLGAGTGYFALPVARRLAELGGGRVLGIDIEPRMLEILRARAEESGLAGHVERFSLDEAHPEDLPVETASADRALLVALYHELPDPERSLRELWRVVRPGGFLIVVDWDSEGSAERGPPREQRVAPTEVERVLILAGFSDVTRLALYDSLFALRAVHPL